MVAITAVLMAALSLGGESHCLKVYGDDTPMYYMFVDGGDGLSMADCFEGRMPRWSVQMDEAEELANYLKPITPVGSTPIK